MYAFSTVNPEGATYATTVHNANGINALKDSYCMIIRDGPHWHRSVETRRDEYTVQLITEPLHICYMFWAYSKPNLPTHAINIIKIVSISIAIVPW